MAIVDKIGDGVIGAEIVIFEMIICHKCKVPFMVTQEHRAKLLKTGDGFYCPAGHTLVYSKPKEECPTKLEKTQKELEYAWHLVREIRDEKWELDQKLRDLRKTECPHCGVRRINIGKHIAKYHSDEK